MHAPLARFLSGLIWLILRRPKGNFELIRKQKRVYFERGNQFIPKIDFALGILRDLSPELLPTQPLFLNEEGFIQVFVQFWVKLLAFFGELNR